ncbi:MAG: PKD domain-containing protein [Bacteroidota bacterium]
MHRGCFPLTVNFTDISTGSPSSWTWDFGNGNTSTLQNPAAVFPAPGSYNISLTVSNGGAPSTLIKSAFIVVHDYPAVDFSFDAASGCAPLTVKFKDNTPPATGRSQAGNGYSVMEAAAFQPIQRMYSINLAIEQFRCVRRNEFGCEAIKTAAGTDCCTWPDCHVHGG